MISLYITVWRSDCITRFGRFYFLYVMTLIGLSTLTSIADANDCPFYTNPINDPSPAMVSDWQDVSRDYGAQSTNDSMFTAPEGMPDDAVDYVCESFGGNTSSTTDNYFWKGHTCSFRKGEDGNDTIGLLGDVLPDSCSDTVLWPVYDNDYALAETEKNCRVTNDVVVVVYAKKEYFICPNGYQLRSGTCELIDQCPDPICEDGFPESAGYALGYSSCDRPDIQYCSDTDEYALSTAICPINLDSGTDSDTSGSDGSSTEEPGTTDTDTTDSGTNDSGSDTTGTGSTGTSGSGTSGSTSDSSDTSNTDTSDTGTTDSTTGDSSNTDSSTTDTGTSDSGTTGADTTDSGSGDTGTGGSGYGDSGTSGSDSGGNGPCDPTEPDYYQCLNNPLSNLPAHSSGGVSSIEEANTNFKSRIDNSPVIQAFTGMSELISLNNPECPVFSIDFPAPINTTASTQIHCNLMETVRPILSPLMIIMYVWIAFRIFASA